MVLPAGPRWIQQHNHFGRRSVPQTLRVQQHNFSPPKWLMSVVVFIVVCKIYINFVSVRREDLPDADSGSARFIVTPLKHAPVALAANSGSYVPRRTERVDVRASTCPRVQQREPGVERIFC